MEAAVSAQLCAQQLKRVVSDALDFNKMMQNKMSMEWIPFDPGLSVLLVVHEDEDDEDEDEDDEDEVEDDEQEEQDQREGDPDQKVQDIRVSARTNREECEKRQKKESDSLPRCCPIMPPKCMLGHPSIIP